MIPLLLPLLAVLSGFSQSNEERGARDIEHHREELDKVKKELMDSRQEIRRLEGRESDLLTKLKGVEKNLTLNNRYLRKLSDMEQALSGDVDSIGADLGRTADDLGKRKALLRERIRQIYLRGRTHDLDALLGAGSFSSFLRRNTFYRAITQNDQRLIRNIFAEQHRIEEKKTDLEIRLSDVQHISEEKRREQNEFEEQKKTRRKILQQVKGEKSTYLKLVAELEKRQQEINAIVAALESTRKAKGKKTRTVQEFDTFSELKGKLPWPVQGRIVKKFGTIVHPDYGTKTINNGVDIAVKEAEKVLAVARGEVVYVGHLPGFGSFLIVSHANGYYSLYANLAVIDVRKGQTVAENVSLGTAGETEVSESPQIHFELRRERRVLDPLQWLAREK